MPSKTFDLKESADRFEILIEGIGAVEGQPSRGETVRFYMEGRGCDNNYGQPCSDASNQPCHGRGEGVSNCGPNGRTYCSKVNEQGCHGAGLYTTNR